MPSGYTPDGYPVWPAGNDFSTGNWKTMEDANDFLADIGQRPQPGFINDILGSLSDLFSDIPFLKAALDVGFDVLPLGSTLSKLLGTALDTINFGGATGDLIEKAKAEIGPEDISNALKSPVRMDNQYWDKVLSKRDQYLNEAWKAIDVLHFAAEDYINQKSAYDRVDFTGDMGKQRLAMVIGMHAICTTGFLNKFHGSGDFEKTPGKNSKEFFIHPGFAQMMVTLQNEKPWNWTGFTRFGDMLGTFEFHFQDSTYEQAVQDIQRRQKRNEQQQQQSQQSAVKMGSKAGLVAAGIGLIGLIKK